MKHYEVVCAIILNSDKKVFVCERGPGRALAYKYEFPGGKVELNETHEQTIIREIKEELKTDIKPIKFLCKSTYEYSKEETKEYEPFGITLYAYLCEIINGELILTEHVSSSFVSKEEIVKLDFAEADKPIINYIITEL